MKISTTSSVLALAAASTGSAQTTTYTNQSAPFTLQIANSANASLNGLYLFSCHAGAAIEGICVGGSTPISGASSTFYYNTTDTDVSGSDDGQGLLVWNLPVSGLPGTDHVSQSAALQPYRPGTNVVVPLFGFDAGTPVHFDDDKLTIKDYYNDANYVAGQFPDSTPAETVYNNWYSCWTGVGGGYTYEALSWVTAGVPHNPTCEKIDVIRTFL
ncbi:hypothetical protein CONLIGDRAFT_174127 [Coniochaeta ligniaria NRRL 30616]|uniref:DUF7907 domain-containing protein n=1 Tax=Coniochaeta ligniaria NRRL 30616 TaxID=1408157 RepID=A0A1J7JZU5_9PEZI|nr:hypothetical protein CONLIGDRAFT_174127 [Coniochaeta ligniaria NRRL 30616]